jgi:hypothetical protein
MTSQVDWQVWAGRICLVTVATLGLSGMYFENVRFIPIAAGFGILALVCYLVRPTVQAPPFRGSGQHPAL